MLRTKTVKKTKTTINGQPPLASQIHPQVQVHQGPTSMDFIDSLEKGFDEFFQSENKNTLKKQWIKLDRALKADRIRDFVSSYQDVTEEGRIVLSKFLLSNLDRGALKARNTVNYNTETCKIEEIKGLIHTVVDGIFVFRIEQPRTTKRRTYTKEK